MPHSPAPRSRLLRRLILVLLLLLPLVELFVLFNVSRLIGGWWTVGLMMATSIAGASVVRAEGLRSWRSLREATRTGAMPSRSIADSGLILAGGFLLVLPGLITDVVGLLLILPLTRPLARVGLAYLVANKVGVPIMTQSGGFGPGAPGPGGQTPNGPGRSTDQPGAGTTIQSDVIE